MPVALPELSNNAFLYAASAYCGIHAALFTFAPEVPSADSFGEEEAKQNRPLRIMTSVTGTLFAVVGTTAFCLARGVDQATAVHCGLSVVPIRMAYDKLVENINPPKAAVALTAGIVGAGFLLPKWSK